MKKLAINVVKFGVSLAIVTYLVNDVARNDPTTFDRLLTEPKDWKLLAAAAACLLGGLTLGWTRWCLLARALGLRLRFRDAYRLGFLSYMLDFLALGTAGGDVAKAVMLGREQGRRWGEAVASVVLDRVIGLFTLTVVATVAVLSTDLSAFTPQIRTIAKLMLGCALGATTLMTLMFVPRVQSAIFTLLGRLLPRVGAKLVQLTEAARMYERRRLALAAIVLLSLGVPCLNVTGFYLIASGLPMDAPSLAEHFVIIPPAMISGVTPLPMEALGVFEYAVRYLYEHIAGPDGAGGQGLLVALTYRVLTIAIILAGTPLYLGARREIRAALDEADDKEEH